MNLPPIGITLGDPAGIGPEIVARAVADPRVRTACQPVVCGDRAVFAAAARQLGLTERIAALGEVTFVDSGVIGEGELPVPGEVSALGGRAAYVALQNCTELALAGRVRAMATAPISKEALQAAGVPFIGHTEILAELTGSADPLTLFVVRDLRVFFLSRHVSLRAACELVTKENLAGFTRRAYRELARLLGDPAPKVAIAGLNPHCGENGLFGDEELTAIAPAVRELQAEGLAVFGPYPADSIFYRALQGEFAAVISLYHDQGHIATKMVDFERTISLTLGLPFVRTSVDHGTAFDIAGKGIASPVSMIEAILTAAKFA